MFGTVASNTILLECPSSLTNCIINSSSFELDKEFIYSYKVKQKKITTELYVDHRKTSTITTNDNYLPIYRPPFPLQKSLINSLNHTPRCLCQDKPKLSGVYVLKFD